MRVHVLPAPGWHAGLTIRGKIAATPLVAFAVEVHIGDVDGEPTVDYFVRPLATYDDGGTVGDCENYLGVLAPGEREPALRAELAAYTKRKKGKR